MQKRTNIKRMRQELKNGTVDLYDLPLDQLGPRQTRKLAKWFWQWKAVHDARH